MPNPWFEVHAALAVQANDEDDAIRLVADAIRHRERPARVGVGIFPVGDFAANPIEGKFPSQGRGPKLPPRVNRAGLAVTIASLRNMADSLEQLT